MSEEESRKAILARRACFIAAALATTGIGAVPACSSDSEPDKASDAGDAEPQPCLKFAPDSSFDAGSDGDAG